MEKKKIGISDGEWKIMRALWEKEPRTITELVAELKEETGWTKHTVITMLGRLEKKGAVAYREGERAKHFYPVFKKEETELQETRGFLQKVYNGSLGLMVNQMVKGNTLSKEEVDELYAILRQAEEGERIVEK